MQNFASIYVFLILITASMQLFLSWLNARQLQPAYDKQPDFLRTVYDRTSYEKACLYEKDKFRLGVVSILFDTFILLSFVVFDWLGVLYVRLAESLGAGLFSDVLFLIAVMAILQAAHLPLALYSTFVIEAKHGFNTITGKKFFSDLLKGTVIGVPLFAGVVAVLLFLLAELGEFWWLYAAGFVFVFQFVLGWAYPKFILPFFNTFRPLDDAALDSELKSLAERAGVGLTQIEEMDASQRSRHGNAFFAGIGRSRRLVVFDTLREQLSNRELIAVIAHEFGHARLGHIWKSLIFSGVLMLFCFWIAAYVFKTPEIFYIFGFWKPSGAALLALLFFASAPVFFVIGPFSTILSRLFEYQADRAARELVGESESLCSALVTLAKENLAHPRPHPWVVCMSYSHPSIEQRLDVLRKESK